MNQVVDETRSARAVAEGWFSAMGKGDIEAALDLLDPDVEFINYTPEPGYNTDMAWIGTYHGRDAAAASFGVFTEACEVRSEQLAQLVVDGNEAMGVVREVSVARNTGIEFRIEFIQRLTVSAGKIVRWQSYTDPSPIIRALRGERDVSEALISAIQSGDSHQVSALVADGSDPSYRDPATGLTVLMMAAGRGDAATVRALIEAGADVLTADRDAGATALHKACQGGSLEVVTALVAAGAFVDAVAPTTGHTALMDALWFKFPEIARYLMDQGAGLNLSTHYGFSLKEHFEYELNVNTVGKDRLLLAGQYLTDRQAANDRLVSEQRLMAAVARGDTDAVRQLIAGGDDVDARAPRLNNFNDGHTPLLVAARDGHIEIARLLLDAGADVNATEPVFGAVPLHKAVYNGHAELTRMIAAEPGVRLDYQGATNGYTPLHDALWHGYEDCGQELISAGARLDLRGHDGKTPLDLACEVFGAGHPLTGRIRARARAMIHQLIFAAPKPGMSVQDFQRYWLEVHAPGYASKIPQIRKYLVDTRLPFDGDEAPPLWSGAAEIWLANDEEQLASMQTPEFLQGARADEPNWAAFWQTLVLDTDPDLLRAGDHPAPADGVKLILLVKRVSGMPLTEFRERSRDQHAKLMLAVPGLRRYLHGYTRDGAYAVGEAALDAAYQLSFDSEAALRQALSSPEYRDATADLLSFVTERYLHRMVMREHWIIGSESD
jgi:uncharacterized protein (TIGR02118 family)